MAAIVHEGHAPNLQSQVFSPGLNGSTPSTQLPRANALSSKISSVLSASYADLEIRDALETLEARQITNTADTRRNLRLDVQKEILSCNGEIVQDFGHVAKQLQSVGAALANLQKTCAEMRKHISAARVETAPILDEASTLTRQKEQVELKQQMLVAFKKHFLLSDDELASLTSTAEAVNDRFFDALTKAKAIHKDSHLLLGTENQRLGLEILDQTSKQLDAAFQKLHRWIQREFKSLDLENPHMNAAIRRALRVLAERPTLFQSCLDSFAEARERTLEESFYGALTGTLGQEHDPLERQKPIEFSAHEPLRYIGDMLAWVHSATVSEREALETLFISEGDDIARGIRAGMDSEPWSQHRVPETADGEVQMFDGRKALSQLVDRNLAGAAQILQQRVERVVRSHDEPVLAYKIANLVGFYRNIFAKLMDADAGFMHTLDVLEDSALTQFRTTMRYNVASIQNEQWSASDDLTPPPFLDDTLEQLRALLKSYDTSAVMTDHDGTGLDLLLAESLDPFLSLCEALAQALPPPANDIYILNCLLSAKTTLSPFPFTAVKGSAMDAAIRLHTASLTQFQHAFLLHESGLHALVAALAPFVNTNTTNTTPSADDLATISALPEVQPEALVQAGQRLDGFLMSALMDAMENVGRLGSRALAAEVTGKAVGEFVEEFAGVEEVLGRVDAGREDEEGRTGLREMFPRTGEEIRILLS